MRIPFDSNFEIRNGSDLFGQARLLSQLVSLAKRRSCVQLIGLRRFGKTSLLNCLISHFRQEVDTCTYPVFVDFKQVGDQVQGTTNVYRYLIALTIANLTEDQIFDSPITIRNQTLSPSKYWEDVYKFLVEVDDIRVSNIFEDLVCFFSDLCEKSFLFLFDEYEYLFRVTFDSPTGFMKMRNFSSKRTPKGITPFFFFVAGGVTWDRFCSLTGSGELNCIDTLVRVNPIDYPSFIKMLDFEWSLSEDSNTLNSDIKQKIYEQAGGVPYFGKLIGGHFLVHKELPDWSKLRAHITEILNSLEVEQRECLMKLTSGPKGLVENEHVYELRDSGLIVKKGKVYEIVMGSLGNYIKLRESANNGKDFNEETYRNVEIIGSLIQTINETNNNKKGKYIFKPVNDDAAILRDLRTTCSTSTQFTLFAKALYKVVFEKTKTGDTMKATLPSQMQNTEFVQIVDIMRHSLGGGHLMGTFKLKQGQMSKEVMLHILTSSKNDPFTSHDFQNLQLVTLKRFQTELESLNAFVRALV